MRNGGKPSRRPVNHERRNALGAIAVSVGATALCGPTRALAVPPPKESGLSYEGLLKGRPGFQPRTPAPLETVEIPGFLSKAQMARSYGVYRDAFARLLTAEKALQSASRAPAQAQEYRELRRQQIDAANAVLLYEFYFRNLAAGKAQPPRYVRRMMSEHMGPFETWQEDFTACARAAEAWAVLVYDPYDDRWHNLPLGPSDAGGMAGANPLVVCRVVEDAWADDYRDRDTYIAAFLGHLNWDEVASRYRAVDRQ